MARGRSFTIFVSHPSHFLTDCEPHGDGLLANEYLRRLAIRGHVLHVAVPLMKLSQPMPAGIHLHPIRTLASASAAHPSAPHRLEYAWRVRALLQRLRQQVRFDLIHQFNPVVPGVGLLLGGMGLPIVLGPLPAPDGRAAQETMTRRVVRSVLHRQMHDATMILVPSMASLPLVPEDPRSRAKVRELHYGIDTDLFSPGPAPATGPQVILFLARLAEQKAPDLMLTAFELLAERNPRAVLWFAGAGDEEGLRRDICRSEVRGRIHLLGNVRREDIPRVMNKATVYCLPSRYESFGMTVLEAMACGRPAVGASVGGLAWLLAGNPESVFPAGDSEALAAVLERFLRSPSLCEEVGLRNRATVVREYAWEAVIDHLENLYAEVQQTDAQNQGAAALASAPSAD